MWGCSEFLHERDYKQPHAHLQPRQLWVLSVVMRLYLLEVLSVCWSVSSCGGVTEQDENDTHELPSLVYRSDLVQKSLINKHVYICKVASRVVFFSDVLITRERYVWSCIICYCSSRFKWPTAPQIQQRAAHAFLPSFTWRAHTAYIRNEVIKYTTPALTFSNHTGIYHICLHAQMGRQDVTSYSCRKNTENEALKRGENVSIHCISANSHRAARRKSRARSVTQSRRH